MSKNHKEHITIWAGMLILLAISIIGGCVNTGEKEKVKKSHQNFERGKLENLGDISLTISENQRIYENWMDFSEERDLPYTDAEGIKIIRQAYAKVDFDGEFIQGDLENYDEYVVHFSELLNNNLPFLNKETGKETYLKEFDRLAIYEDLEYSQIIVQCEYILFDIDGDKFPELGIRNENDHNAVYVFDYNEQTGKCELWYTLENYWYVILGSKKIAWIWDDRYLAFYQLGSSGDIECHTLGISRWFNEEESLHMVMLPAYTREESIYIPDWLKEQGVFSQSDEQWFFRITEEQYEELMAPYWEAYFKSQEEIMKVTYTYEELFGSLIPSQ